MDFLILGTRNIYRKIKNKISNSDSEITNIFSDEKKFDEMCKNKEGTLYTFHESFSDKDINLEDLIRRRTKEHFKIEKNNTYHILKLRENKNKYINDEIIVYILPYINKCDLIYKNKEGEPSAVIDKKDCILYFGEKKEDFKIFVRNNNTRLEYTMPDTCICFRIYYKSDLVYSKEFNNKKWYDFKDIHDLKTYLNTKYNESPDYTIEDGNINLKLFTTKYHFPYKTLKEVEEKMPKIKKQVHDIEDMEYTENNEFYFGLKKIVSLYNSSH